MLTDDDLEAAIDANVLTPEQADKLRAFALARSKPAVGARADEERFRFIRGFNDIFFAIGVALLGGGLALAAATAGPVGYIAAAVAMWGLAELLVRRRRLVTSGIVIIILFVGFVVAAVPLADILGRTGSTFPRSPDTPFGFLLRYGSSYVVMWSAAIGAVAALGFYARFRFPFALLMLAGNVVLAAHAACQMTFAPQSAAISYATLMSGLVVFAAAMWFDSSDRLRTTRWSDCAFWLHVLAAPLIVHSLVRLTTDNIFKPDMRTSIVVLLIAAVLAVVALVIDRRALLVSALLYVGSVIAYVIAQTKMEALLVSILTLLVLGGLVLMLGIGWAPLRRRVLALLPLKIAAKVPPVAA